jgi:hypothetical protein
LLKTQVDDLIRKGANPLLKRVVLDLWMAYLRKVGIAFMPPNSQVNLKNIRGVRNEKYFEIYQLKQECETANQPDQVDDLVWPDFFKEEPTSVTLQPDGLKNTNESITDEDDDDDDAEIEEQEVKDESVEVEGSVAGRQKSRIVPLIKFEWIRMPHTLCILNLALLIIKSNVLITDLIR